MLETTVGEQEADEVSVLETTVEEGASAVLVAVGVTVEKVGIENEVQYSEGKQTLRAELKFRDRGEVFRFVSGA